MITPAIGRLVARSVTVPRTICAPATVTGLPQSTKARSATRVFIRASANQSGPEGRRPQEDNDNFIKSSFAGHWSFTAASWHRQRMS
jgi:hypothetical protein